MGQKEYDPFLLYHCWQAVGEAWHIFDSCLAQDIKKILANCSDQLCELTWSVFMIGLRRSHSKPTVVFSDGNRAKRNLAMRLVQTSGLLDKPRYLGFKLLAMKYAPDMKGSRSLANGTQGRETEHGFQGEKPVVLYKRHSDTIGKPILVELNEGGGILRKATAGGILDCGGKYYYMTAAHVFEGGTVDYGSTKPPESDDELELDGLSDFEDDPDKNTVDVTSGGSVTPEYMSSSIRALSKDVTSEDSTMEENIQQSDTEQRTSSQASFTPLHESEISDENQLIDVPPKRSESPKSGYDELGHMKFSSASGPYPSLDYALIEIEAPIRPYDIADILNPGNEKYRPFYQLGTEARSPRDADVITVTASGGSLRGRLLLGRSFKIYGKENYSQELWTVELKGKLAVGDCGAWVFDAATGELYGHLVAGNTDRGFAYIVPAHEVFKDIRERFSIDTKVCTRFNHNLRLSDTDGASHAVEEGHWPNFSEGLDRPDSPSLAAQRGREEIAELLLAKESVDPDPLDMAGRTPLSYAAEKGLTRTVQLLVKRKGVNVNTKDLEYSRTPLIWAAVNRQETVVKLLLATHGVDPNASDRDGRTALSYAAEMGLKTIVELIVATKGVDLDTKDTEYSRTPLLWAAVNGKKTVVNLLLAQDGVDPNARDQDGRTALSYATGADKVDSLTESKGNRLSDSVTPGRTSSDVKHNTGIPHITNDGTIERIVSIGQLVSMGRPPGASVEVAKEAEMHVGTVLDEAQVAENIVRIEENDESEKPANPSVSEPPSTSFAGRTIGAPDPTTTSFAATAPRTLELPARPPPRKPTASSFATKQAGEGLKVDTSSKEKEGNDQVDIKDENQTPPKTALEAAIIQDDEKMVLMLLDNGADVNAPSDYGTAIHAASYWGRTHCVKMLIERGADVNTAGRIYRTALGAAVRRGHEEVVKMLLQAGADPNGAC